MTRRLLAILGAVAVLVVVVVGLNQAGGSDAPEGSALSLQEAQERLEGAPPELAALHEQGNELLDGTGGRLQARLRELRGHPVVINKWASWCGPCRTEFPAFQEVAADLGKEVAFVGLNSGDDDGAASRFLARFPVAYPSYTDPDGKVAPKVGAGTYFPTTVFLDERGKTAAVHQGPYETADDLRAAIERHLDR
jgi:thiol-disulfide isomerase/thioredoxin